MNPKFTHSSQVLLSLLAASLLMGTEARAQAASEMRQWTNQQGRAIQAALVRVDGENVVLRLANGTESTVPLANLSQADQAYARVKKTGGAGPVTGGGGALAWPKEVITVDPKTIVVTPGEQNEKARQYHYRSGTFEFIANAPLAGTVMSEVASDFELLRTAFTRLPWGWEPAPREGSHFQIYLTETEEDFIAMGGDERSASGSKNDKNFIRFSAMGLKKVGAKYQYDARQKEPGRAAGMTVRVMAWDFRGRMAPWVLSGLETFMRQLAYQSNGTVKFADLETDLKRYLKEMADNTQPDVPRMLRYLRQDWNTRDTNTALKALYDRQLDALLLLYYFAYLDGEGKGADLHEYFRTVFAKRGSGTDLNAMIGKLTGGRDDTKLAADIKEKFAAINVKLEK